MPVLSGFENSCYRSFAVALSRLCSANLFVSPKLNAEIGPEALYHQDLSLRQTHPYNSTLTSVLGHFFFRILSLRFSQTQTE